MNYEISSPLLILFFIFLFSILGLFFMVYYFFWRCRRQEWGNNDNDPARPIDLSEGDGQIVSSLWKVNKAILSALDFEKLTEEVVNVILKELNYMKIGYRISVLTLVDKEAGIIRRVSFSPTPEALEILSKANVRFRDIEIPLNAKGNLLVRAIEDQKTYITHDLSDVFYPEKTREIWRQLQQKVSIKTSLIFPLIIKNESIGAMIFSLSKSEKEIGDYEKGVLGGFTDAVAVALENANLYRRLRQANEKLQELDQRKNEFLSVAAHELRAPMTAIKGYLSMILEGDAGEISQTVKEYLKQGVEGNDRLIRLVNNMLNVARIEEGRLVYEIGTVSLKKVVERVFCEFKTEAEDKKLEFNLEMASDLKDQVYVDQDRIHEVVANLISNAIRYTDKGSVLVKMIQPSQQKIRFEVIDTGEGISEAEQKKLFQKFFRAESNTGKKIGTGLGLYISKLLVEKFGGTIGVISQKGKGSTFWFELPLKT